MLFRKHYWIIAAIIIVALAASIMLMPRARELALMELKDKHFIEARTAYEAELANGNLSLEVTNHLADLYLQVGAIDKAIQVMEKYVAANPNNLEAHVKLGTLYQYAQRPNDYMRNLEEINQIKSKPENLVALSSIYNFSGQYEKQTGVLQKLIVADKGKNPKYFTDLANIQASQHNYTGAIATLHELQTTHPNDFSFENVALLVSLLLDNKQPQEASQIADAWIQAHNNPEQSAELINILHFQGSVALGNAEMAKFNEQQINANPALLDAFILLELGDGKEDAAYKRLKDLYDANRLAPSLNKRLLFLAVSHGDRELAHKLLKNTELTTLSETQLLALVELAQSQHDALLLKDITDAFPEQTSYKTYPVLTAGLAVANKHKDADTLLARLDSATLGTEQLLQVANICSMAGRDTCVNHFLDKLPSSDKLSNTDVAGVGQLYFNMHQYDKGYAYIQKERVARKSAAIEAVAIEFSAARGDTADVKAWLAANPDKVNPRLLSDLYFAALNNRKLPTALYVAEVYHDKYDTSLSRSLLANAYIKTGQYQLAINLLRNNSPRSQDDENNYLTALVKLAPHNPQYKTELRNYAASRLRSGVSGRTKLALIYGLMDAGQIDIAMPYIRELALKNGGQWAALYAEQLDKEGKYAESRKFWLEVADQPYATLAEKKMIAFNLLDHGDKADAERLFIQVAAHEGPDSNDVKDLLYLMGPRPTQQEMEWLETRYTEASGKDKERWAALIDDYAAPEFLTGFVTRHPEAMNNPKITADYFQAMQDKGRLASMENGYIAYTKKYKTTSVMYQYAAVADTNGLRKEALTAYETIASVDPADYVAVRQAGVLAYEQADYKTSSHYLGQYVQHYKSNPDTDANAYIAYFYYGETLRHNNQPEQAKPYYRTAYRLLETKSADTAETAGIRAQSQVWSGDVKGGLLTFNSARKTYPDNDDLHAEQISVLVELGRYDEARKQLPKQSQVASAAPVSGIASLPAFSQPVKGYTLLNGNSELLIHFTGPVSEATANSLANNYWVSYTNEGYDTLLVAAKPGYVFQTASNAPKTIMNAADNDVSAIQIVPNTHTAEQKDNAKQNTLRYALLAARVDLETGHVYDATKRLNNMMPDYKNDSQFLGFTANAENYGGNWPQAEQLIRTARATAPNNEDLAIFERDMRRENSPNATLDFEWVDYAKSLENITTLKGMVNVTNHVLVGGDVQDNYIEGKNLRLSNGTVGDSNGNRERGEVYAMYYAPNGIKLQGSVFGNNNTAGVGGYFTFLNPLGETLLTGEFHKPYWDLPEAVLDDADRDRVAFLHTIKPTTRLTLDGGLGFNRYNVKDIDDVTTSITAQIDAVYRLIEGQERVRPTIEIGYGLDGEYTRTDKDSFDATGTFSRDLPLVSREIHSIYGDAAYAFSSRTYGDLLLGYEYDRFGGNGPIIEGKINHEFSDAIDAQLRASYTLDPTNTQDTIAMVGGYVRWRF